MKRIDLDYILTTMLEAYDNVSDLNITVGKALQVESSGELVSVAMMPKIEKLTPFQTEQIVMMLVNADRRLTDALLREGSCDSSYYLEGKARFRVNVFSQKSTYTIIMRKLETRIPTIEELKLPKVFTTIAQEKNGIVLVTGSTGSGKSTSLAAMLDYINDTKSIHVVTLEDPVEFVHPHKKSTFNQRELGTDYDTFASGLRAALRQAPKVILVGEMRDRETVEIGISAAETGHLVVSTLHTVNAGQTINRIVGMFDKEEETQMRIRLAETVRWIVCQRLAPKVGGGRKAILEIMGTNLRVRDVILNGESEGKTYYEIIEASKPYGFTTFDMSLVNAFAEGSITEDTAKAYASYKAVVGRAIDRLRQEKGEETSDIMDLSIDTARAAEQNKEIKALKRKGK